MVVKKNPDYASFFQALPYNQTFGVGRNHKPTTPSFSKMFDIKPTKIDKELKNMFKSNKKNKLFGDWDKDGVLNFNDCKPKNSKKHGGEAFGYYLWQRGIRMHPATPKKQQKQIRRMFEKRPELIKHSATGLDIDGETKSRVYFLKRPDIEGMGRYMSEYKPTIKDNLENREAIILPKEQYKYAGKTVTPEKTLTHELTHRYDAYTLSEEQHKKDKEAEDEYYARPKKERTPERYVNLPAEQRAIKSEEATPVRNIPVSEEVRARAYRKMMSDNDNDGTPNVADGTPDGK